MPVAPTSAASLLELCRKSGLVEEADLKRVLKGAPLPDEPAKAAGILIKKGLLTRFQAGQLLAGRHRGFRIGGYKVLDKLGRGGNAAVFLCEQVAMRRKVALKVLPHRAARDEGIRERFYREGRAAAALDHPNIVRTHDIDSAGGMHYLVMEYIEGTNLQKVLDSSGPVPYHRAVGYALQAAAGLEHAHAKGIVHRDIKPANLLVNKEGTLKILDMGLARFFRDPKDNLTRQYDEGMVLGTVDFLAPEQAVSLGDLDSRADIYSLGATLYTLIRGKPPFEGPAAQKLLMVQFKAATPLAQVCRDVPTGLSEVVARMMAKDPAERYQTAGEVIEALHAWRSATAERRALTFRPARDRETPRDGSQAPTARTMATEKVRPEAPATPPPLPTQPSRSRRWALSAGVGAGLFAGVLAVVLGSGKAKPTTPDNTTFPINESQTPALSQPPPGGGVGATAPAEKGRTVAATVVYRFSAADHKPFLERKRGWSTLGKTGDGGMPNDWVGGCWKPESAAEFLVQEVSGKVGLGFRNFNGDPTAQLLCGCGGRLKQLTDGSAYAVRFRYLGEEGARATAFVRASAAKTIASVELHPTGGEWREVELPFTAGKEPLEFVAQTAVTDPRSTVFFAELELAEIR